jgi:hypothetical protein
VQIGVTFGGSETIRNLILHYLLIEAPPRYARRRRGAPSAAFAAIPYKVRWRIRRWLEQLDTSEKPQRGLYLTGATPALLTAAARFTIHEAGQLGRAAILVGGNDRIATSHAKVAVETSLLVIERIEFASESVTRLIHARSDALRPMIVTSCRDREELSDQELVRVFRAWTETITVAAPRTRSSTTSRHHAARS